MPQTLTIITGIPLLDQFLGLFDAYGYLITFAATVFENLFIVGSVTPGEVIVMAAGFVAARGELTWQGVWLASVLGTVIGSNVSYILGRRGGRQTILRYGARFHISEQRLKAAEDYFAVHGSKTIFLARFAAGVKNWVPMIAGASKMPIAWFEGWTILGAITYTSAMVALGYFFGDEFDRLLKWVQRAGVVGLVLLLALVVLAVWGRRRFNKRRHRGIAERAEELRAEGEDADLDMPIDRANAEDADGPR